MSNRIRIAGAALLPLAVVGLITGCSRPAGDGSSVARQLSGPVAVDQARLLKGTDDPHQWSTYGGNYGEHRFSPLTAINDGNVKNLGLAWYGDYDTNLNMHGSPLYVDGVIYVSTSRNWVHAFDARTGRKIWTYAPQQVPHSNLGQANKGIAAYNGKIYIGLVDSRMVAIDAKTGKAVWENDIAPVSLVGADMVKAYSISMPPRIAKGKVFVGASGAEYGGRGFIVALDAETGKELWRFWTVPGDPAKGADQPHLVAARKTWPANREYWKQGGGGTIWDATVYDPVTDLLYFGTGNGTPWNREMRDATSGDNLYVASVVAVDPDTGKYVWHYQETPGDSWDYDATSPMVVTDLVLGGRKQHVIVHPSKNGFIYVFEAASGKLLSADKFVDVTWASGIDMKTGRPIEVPGARHEKEPFNVSPNPAGAHTWHPNAFSPVTGLVYIPTRQNYAQFSPQTMPASGVAPLGSSFRYNNFPADLKPHNKTADEGYLQAWDPVARKMVWESERETPRGSAGAMVTAGNIVFMGNSAGKKLRAFNAKTGAKLWEFDAQTDVYAAPITYELDGVQYIAASVGGTTAAGDYFAPSYGRMLVFKVGGTVKLPANAPYTPRQLNPPPATASAAVVARGAQVYADNCSVCHGTNAVTLRDSNAPLLTTTPLLHVQQGFDQVVLQGGRVDRGMPDFRDKLTPADSAAVLSYVVSRANEVKNQPAAAPGARGAAGGAAR
jgi:quinohemoprotein ethanol dehydrogenase